LLLLLAAAAEGGRNRRRRRRKKRKERRKEKEKIPAAISGLMVEVKRRRRRRIYSGGGGGGGGIKRILPKAKKRISLSLSSVYGSVKKPNIHDAIYTEKCYSRIVLGGHNIYVRCTYTLDCARNLSMTITRMRGGGRIEKGALNNASYRLCPYTILLPLVKLTQQKKENQPNF
jgi:hypothetical protein